MSIIIIINRSNTNSFFNDKNRNSFIHAFHQTPGDHLTSPLISNGFHIIRSEPSKPINPNYSGCVSDPSPVAGEFKVSEIGLMSCTESLGFESSEEMISSLDDEGSFRNGHQSSPSSPSPTSSESGDGDFRVMNTKTMMKTRTKTKTKAELPPPLTSLSENGRRNFTLKSVRKDGRLEIVGVMIERPEILCASRKNGRLRLHLVQTSVQNDDDDDDDDENDDEVVVTEEEELAAEETAEEEDQWRVATAAAARRCYHMREVQVWGQQHRYVTTM